MFKNTNLLKKIALICISLFFLVLVWRGGHAPARAQYQSRINSLEVDINGIEARLSRIEAQLNQFSRGAIRAPANPSPRSNTGQNRLPLSREQMFDRLATLVIEIKQQTRQLEARVSKLESRGAPPRGKG